MPIRFHVTYQGTDAVRAAFKVLPIRFLVNAVGVASGFAITPLGKEIANLTPTGTGLTSDGRQRSRGGGHLKDAIGKRKKVYRRKYLALAFIGYDLRMAPHGTMIEAGAKPHKIPVNKPRSAEIQIWRKSRINLFMRLRKGQVIRHPGFAAIAPVKKAMSRRKAEVINRFASKLEKQIPKEVDKVRKAIGKGKYKNIAAAVQSL